MNDFEKAQELGLTTIDRWSNAIPHHPMSKRLMEFLQEHDTVDYSSYFDWRMGGDGDNGESLMYQMDAFFEMLDKTSLAMDFDDNSPSFRIIPILNEHGNVLRHEITNNDSIWKDNE